MRWECGFEGIEKGVKEKKEVTINVEDKMLVARVKNGTS